LQSIFFIKGGLISKLIINSKAQNKIKDYAFFNKERRKKKKKIKFS
jgi:hypothetical protein